jgi:hypothetical protein
MMKSEMIRSDTFVKEWCWACGKPFSALEVHVVLPTVDGYVCLDCLRRWYAKVKAILLARPGTGEVRATVYRRVAEAVLVLPTVEEWHKLRRDEKKDFTAETLNLLRSRIGRGESTTAPADAGPTQVGPFGSRVAASRASIVDVTVTVYSPSKGRRQR